MAFKGFLIIIIWKNMGNYSELSENLENNLRIIIIIKKEFDI